MMSMNALRQFKLMKQSPAPPTPAPEPTMFFRDTGAVAPFVFFLLHMATFHAAVRVLPAKRITYPLLLVHALFFFAAEHYTKELPTLASVLPLIALPGFATLPFSFYYAFKKTTGSK